MTLIIEYRAEIIGHVCRIVGRVIHFTYFET